MQIKDGDQWKAAFITNQGLFKPTVMFFRLTNSLATFQTMMNTIFASEMAEGWLTIYMDDMAIHTKPNPSKTEGQHRECHQQNVQRVLSILQHHNLFLKLEKCTFEQLSINFLGIVVNQGEVRMDESKVVKVQEWPPPTNITEVCKLLGLTSYYQYFIRDYSMIA